MNSGGGGGGDSRAGSPAGNHKDGIQSADAGAGMGAGRTNAAVNNRTRVLYMSLAAIFSAFVVELVLGVVSNSLALITDSIHALLDCIVTAVLLIATRMAIKPPDAEHTYGHGKIESLGGMMGGIAIFAIACFFIYESLHRFQSPPPSVLPGMLAIAGGLYTIGVDVFRIVLLKRSLRGEPGASLGGSTTVKADLYHAVMDLGSTTVAIVGIYLAYTGTHQGDLAAALILGGLLAALSIKLVHRTALDLTDVISPEMVSKVRGVANATDGVIMTGSVLMRRSGDTTFADITVSLRGDASFERAHEISAGVEQNVAECIPGDASITVHFEPDWSGVPPDARILDIARRVDGVKSVHNVNTRMTGGKTYADLHVMVDSEMSLQKAHEISEVVESDIRRQMPRIEHTTVHLEPFTSMPRNLEAEDAALNEKIREILEGYPQIRAVGRIIALNDKSASKIDIDCSFDGALPIAEVHGLTSEIERAIAEGLENAVITIHPEPL